LSFFLAVFTAVNGTITSFCPFPKSRRRQSQVRRPCLTCQPCHNKQDEATFGSLPKHDATPLSRAGGAGFPARELPPSAGRWARATKGEDLAKAKKQTSRGRKQGRARVRYTAKRTRRLAGAVKRTINKSASAAKQAVTGVAKRAAKRSAGAVKRAARKIEISL
jgi:hypothetical protein